jgi:hypothetical protein
VAPALPGPGPEGQQPALGLAGAVVGRPFHVGLVLAAAADLPADLVRPAVLDAAARLDELIGQIRDYAFAARTLALTGRARADGCVISRIAGMRR